jgi:phosphohistidine phosphatase
MTAEQREDFDMYLILMRHGIAEDAGPGQPDADRRLTLQGRHRLNDALPGLRRFLAGQDAVEIWSSPLSRAIETAEVLADGLMAEKIRQLYEIASGDLKAFLLQAEKMPAQSTVIVVGHEPTLSLWSQELCGVWLPFKKGAAAAIDIQTVRPPTGQLLWFAQPKTLRRLK